MTKAMKFMERNDGTQKAIAELRQQYQRLSRLAGLTTTSA